MSRFNPSTYPLKQDIQERAINVLFPPIPFVPAKGDGVTDDTTALQVIFDHAFQNGIEVFLPESSNFYLTTKPLVIRGNSNELKYGARIRGASRETCIIKKQGTTSYGGLNAVIVIDNETTISGGAQSGECANIRLSGLKLDGNSQSDHGLAFPYSSHSNVFEDMHMVNYVNSAMYVNANNYLSRYSFFRMDGGQYGLNYAAGTSTSNIWSNMYAVGQSTTAYKVTGVYCHLDSPAADGVTGTVYDLTGFNGTVTNPGSESSSATTTFLGGAYTDATIINPYTYMNPTNASANHISITGTSGQMRFIGGYICYDWTESSKVAAGNLYSLTGYTSQIEFIGTPTIGLSQQAKTDQSQYPKVAVNGGGRPNHLHITTGYEFLDPTLLEPIWYKGYINAAPFWANSKGVAPENKGVNVAVASASTTLAVGLTTTEADANYGVACSPSWNTTYWITAKTTTGFTINFGTAAPAAETLDWSIFR